MKDNDRSRIGSTLFIMLGSLFMIVAILSPVTGMQTTLSVPDDYLITMTVPFPPIPVLSDGVVNIAYELETSDFEEEGYTLQQAEAIDAGSGTVLVNLTEELLQLYHPAAVPPPTDDELHNGTKKLLYPRISFWVRMDPRDVPDTIVHRLTLSRAGDTSEPLVITGGEVQVRSDVIPVSIGAPLNGNGWVAWETTDPFTHHFGSQITMDTVTRVPQRYAQDWLKIDDDGMIVSGDYTKNENWTAYGQEVLAVKDGTVARIFTGVPDNDPVGTSPPINTTRLAGNYVILDIGNGLYACYGHLVLGSITVKEGDRVREGELLGFLGNSGNSDAPHLHFQVTDGPGFLNSEGMPFVFNSFYTIGLCDENLTCTCNETLQLHEGELVENRVVVTFPDTPFSGTNQE